MYAIPVLLLFFFFNDTATTEIYTLSLHDALPICPSRAAAAPAWWVCHGLRWLRAWRADRKSTRLNSSHQIISYAVFCLKKKKVYALKKCSFPRILHCAKLLLSHDSTPSTQLPMLI